MAYKDSEGRIVSGKTKKKTTKAKKKKTKEGQIVWWIENLKLFVGKIKEEGEEKTVVINKEDGKEKLVPNSKLREGNDDDYFK